MNVHGLPVLDLRHLLPNLNNLLLTLSSPVTVPSEQGEAASTDSVLKNGAPAGPSTSNGPGASAAGAASSSAFSTAAASPVDSPTRKRRGGYRMAGKGEIVLPSTPRLAAGDSEGSVEHGETAKEESAGVNGNRHDGSATSSISNATASSKKQAANANAHSPAASWTASLLGWTTGGAGGGSRHRKASGQQDAKVAPPPPGNLPTARRLGGGSG